MNKFTENSAIPTSVQSTATTSKHKIHRDEFISVNMNVDNDNDGCVRKHKRARHTSMAFISCDIDSSPIKLTDDKADCKDECPTLNKVPERNLSLCFESDMYSLLDNHWLSPPSSLQSNKGRNIVPNDPNINEYQFDFSSYSHGNNVMLNINSENNPFISTGNDTKIEMCMSNDSNDSRTSIDSVELQLEFLRTLKKLYKSIQRTDESRNILQRQRFTSIHYHHDDDTYHRNQQNHYHHRRHYDDEHHYTIQLQQSSNYFTTKEWYETELYRKQFKQIIQNDCLHRTVF